MFGALTEVSGGVTADGFSPSGQERPSGEEVMVRLEPQMLIPVLTKEATQSGCRTECY